MNSNVCVCVCVLTLYKLSRQISAHICVVGVNISRSFSLIHNWNENSDEPIGWYHATVKSHHPDGTTSIEYAQRHGNSQPPQC